MYLEETLILLIQILIFILIGIVAGNGAVYVFNKLPAKWLCDYGEEPNEALLSRDRQRLNSHPWKALFSMFFVVVGIKLGVEDIYFALPALVTMWTLLIISIADYKYMIIPDQFIALLAITTFGYVPYYETYIDPIRGALLGGGCMLLIAVVGKLIFKKEALGFGDVKLFTVIGLLVGFYGVLNILFATSMLSCVVYGIKILRKKIKRGDTEPLGPYIAITTTLYLLFSDLYLFF